MTAQPARKNLPAEPCSVDEIHELFQLGYDGRIYKRGSHVVICYPSQRGYRSVTAKGIKVLAHRVAWCLYYGYWPSLALDHIDGDKQNNRITNLRQATDRENCQNRKKWNGGATQLRSGRWQAQISVNNRMKYLGCFDTKPEAEAAYRAAEERLRQ